MLTIPCVLQRAVARLGFRRLATVVAALALIIARQVNAQPGVLTKDLAAVADSVLCDPVPNFYSRSGPLTAPFVYGVEEGETRESAAFWCVRRADRSYLLVIARLSQPTLTFRWWNPPAGLSVVDVRDVQLNEFRLLDDPRTIGPVHLVAESRAIRDEYGGAYTLFVQWNGKWYYRLFD